MTKLYALDGTGGGFGGVPGGLQPSGSHGMGGSMFWPGRAWLPPVNLYETGDEFLVCVDLAGVKRGAIDVAHENGVLRLAGKREDPLPRKKRVHLLEIDEGYFCREIEIPTSVAVGRIKAVLKQGFLWIHLPKKPRRRRAAAAQPPKGQQ